MSEALPLPPSPNAEQYRKLARELQRACESGREDALREWALRWLSALARLRDVPIAAQQNDAAAAEMVRRWHKLKPDCALTTAQLFIAREHGFASWPKFAKHLEEAAFGGSLTSRFEAAVDAIVRGDRVELARLLEEAPGLVRARSTREHRSTLLHYVSANGVEDYRQKTPSSILEIARLLLDAGAEVDAESDAYGGGSTALGLTATSGHPQKAGVQIALLELLLERGGKAGFVNECLRNGRREAAQFLADRGAPLDLEGACGVGRLDLVALLVNQAPRHQLDAGFHWACEYGHSDVVRLLLDHYPDGPNGLHWAAYGAFADIVELLLARGWPVDRKDDRFGATPLGWAIHAWTNEPPQGRTAEDYSRVVSLLVRSGASVAADWLAIVTALTGVPGT